MINVTFICDRCKRVVPKLFTADEFSVEGIDEFSDLVVRGTVRSRINSEIERCDRCWRAALISLFSVARFEVPTKVPVGTDPADHPSTPLFQIEDFRPQKSWLRRWLGR